MNSLLKLVILFVFLLGVLFVRFFFFYQNQPQYQDLQHIEFKTVLLSEPQHFSNYQLITANLYSGQKVYLRVSSYPRYHYQDRLMVSGELEVKIHNKRRSISMYFPKIQALEKESNLFL